MDRKQQEYQPKNSLVRMMPTPASVAVTIHCSSRMSLLSSMRSSLTSRLLAPSVAVPIGFAPKTSPSVAHAMGDGRSFVERFAQRQAG